MMHNKIKKILVLSLHTDDGELGAGGTVAKFLDNQCDVHYCAFSVAETAIPSHLPSTVLADEVKEATQRLGILPENLIIQRFPVRHFYQHRQEILQIMIDMRQKENYDLVLIPSLQDIHQDHQIIAEEALRTFKNISIISYELPWNNIQFNNTCFVVLQENHIQKNYMRLKHISRRHIEVILLKILLKDWRKYAGSKQIIAMQRSLKWSDGL